MLVVHLAFEHMEELYSRSVETEETPPGYIVDLDHVGRNETVLADTMSQELILVSNFGAAALDKEAAIPLDVTAALRLLMRLEKYVIRTLKTRDKACSVVRDGKATPFSTFDNMPEDEPVSCATLAAVNPCLLRAARTWLPIELATSRLELSS